MLGSNVFLNTLFCSTLSVSWASLNDTEILNPYKITGKVQSQMLLKWHILSTLTHSPFLFKKVLYLYFVIHMLEEKKPTVVCDSCVNSDCRMKQPVSCSEIRDKGFEEEEMTVEVQEQNNKLGTTENKRTPETLNYFTLFIPMCYLIHKG
jgi:hypothetical protein